MFHLKSELVLQNLRAIELKSPSVNSLLCFFLHQNLVDLIDVTTIMNSSAYFYIIAILRRDMNCFLEYPSSVVEGLY